MARKNEGEELCDGGPHECLFPAGECPNHDGVDDAEAANLTKSTAPSEGDEPTGEER